MYYMYAICIYVYVSFVCYMYLRVYYMLNVYMYVLFILYVYMCIYYMYVIWIYVCIIICMLYVYICVHYMLYICVCIICYMYMCICMCYVCIYVCMYFVCSDGCTHIWLLCMSKVCARGDPQGQPFRWGYHNQTKRTASCTGSVRKQRDAIQYCHSGINSEVSTVVNSTSTTVIAPK